MVKFNPLRTKAVKDKGTYVFADFSHGLYNLDTPRLLGEQLGSLALIGGRNVISEKGALVPQYGYDIIGELPEDDRIVTITKDSLSAASFFIITQKAEVYLYTAGQGLKKYKTSLESVSDPLVAHRGKDMILYNEGNGYLFGAYYEEGNNVVINEDVTLADYTSYYEFQVSIDDAIFYWNGKEVTVNGEDHLTVVSVASIGGSDTVTVRCISVGEHKLYSSPVTIGEKTLLPIDFIFTPEESDDPTIKIEPALLEVCVNRLFIVDVSGRIYYSQVGVINGFEEKFGAGYFEGFYNSTSKTLSIEDYLDGALICKEDGIYYLTITQGSIVRTIQAGASGESTLAIGENEVNIKKIAQIGQEYATDHVIVRENVYAYDTYSGSIVNAVSVNVFGNLVAGGTIIDARTLNSQASGMNSTKRCLTFNGQENVFILYYGINLDYGIVLTLNQTLFPRQLDIPIMKYIGFNQGVVGVNEQGKIIQDFKEGTVIEGLTAEADFEPIGVRDNRFTCSSILEVTELNGVEYTVATKNAGSSFQYVKPVINVLNAETLLPPLIYSDKKYNLYPDSFQLSTRWADKKSSLTRIYAPMSGRDGVQISLEFPANTTFCLAALRLPDFSQGE